MRDFRSYKVQLDDGPSSSYQGKTVADPPGWVPRAQREAALASFAKEVRSKDGNLALKQQALYGRAMGAIKNVAFMCFIQYMSGSGLHLFSIMSIANGVYQPLHAILTVAKAFPPDPERRLEVMGPRALFCLVQACGLAFTLWKLNGMGLLPTHVSDWVTSTPVAPFKERALTPL